MKIQAHNRLMSLNKPNKPKDYTWQKEATQKQKGKSRNTAQDLKEGIFTENPSAIARELKSKSRDFQHALSRLTFFINRSGKNLPRQEQRRLEQAKDAVYRAYGEEKPKD